MASVPSTQSIENIKAKLVVLQEKLQTHPAAGSPNVFFVMDFIRNSVASLDQILAAQASGSGNTAALKATYSDIAGRIAFAGMLLEDPSKVAMMMGGAGGNVTFGPDILDASKEVQTAVQNAS